MDEVCPCGSGLRYTACCGPYLDGGETAPTAEALMRSRYTAFVRRRGDYLALTWHPDHVPDDLDLSADSTEWLSLTILATSAGGPLDAVGTVEFRARYRHGTAEAALHETSRFVRYEGRWVYTEGDNHPSQSPTVSRNSPCPCGSGRKFKRCCAGK